MIKEPWNMGRQQLPKTYYHNGSIDIFWRKTLTRKNTLSGKKIIPLVQKDFKSSVDVDNYEDFKSLIKIKKKILKKFDLLKT